MAYTIKIDLKSADTRLQTAHQQCRNGYPQRRVQIRRPAAVDERTFASTGDIEGNGQGKPIRSCATGELSVPRRKGLLRFIRKQRAKSQDTGVVRQIEHLQAGAVQLVLLDDRNTGEITIRLHNQQIDLLEYYIDENLDQFDYYVVTPHFPLDESTQRRAVKALMRIPNRKLILLDRCLDSLPGNYGVVYQDFYQ